ncbi:LptA/OstA family protein [Candidatus Hydrogenosomobacter endosymbioticus]|uniref:Organic solvent tolerance-like N-terminal domain-containing protein n=1 Tax=Candidatus Hydrogenosomobacter endosymbioticus TaxID=2558174 RepID=A0ABM7V867_9PROT|nr:LptA/OstA family protein [Candidatus Hydrogenosomobacter endosymbioticus]BDB95959.1 hypothetical protein HYD_0920 [Candidatus Hydrogenosomobacter endosymbioticus]
MYNFFAKNRPSIVISLILCVGICLPAYCSSQNKSAPAEKTDASGEVHVDAPHQIEFLEKENMCIARGNENSPARARKGNVTVSASELRVYFDQSPDGKRALRTIEANGRAALFGPFGNVTSEKLVYTAKKEELVACGGAISLKTPEYSVTANNFIKYSNSELKGTADGNAILRHGDKTISSNVITVFFEKTANKTSNKTEPNGGQLAVKRAIANGNVSMSNGVQNAVGDSAIYESSNKNLSLKGKVRISEGGSSGIGHIGKINLENGKSSLCGNKKQRVKVIVTPKSLQKRPLQKK